jgi:hypothetical protein
MELSCHVAKRNDDAGMLRISPGSCVKKKVLVFLNGPVTNCCTFGDITLLRELLGKFGEPLRQYAAQAEGNMGQKK